MKKLLTTLMLLISVAACTVQPDDSVETPSNDTHELQVAAQETLDAIDPAIMALFDTVDPGPRTNYCGVYDDDDGSAPTVGCCERNVFMVCCCTRLSSGAYHCRCEPLPSPNNPPSAP